jgi:hypothetical protein
MMTILLCNYIPQELVLIFTVHFNKCEEYKSIFYPFYIIYTWTFIKTFGSFILKKWKAKKKALGIRRIDFTTLKRKRKRSDFAQDQQSSSYDQASSKGWTQHVTYTYRNPFNGYRTYRINHHRAFIRFTSSNFYIIILFINLLIVYLLQFYFLILPYYSILIVLPQSRLLNIRHRNLDNSFFHGAGPKCLAWVSTLSEFSLQ